MSKIALDCVTGNPDDFVFPVISDVGGIPTWTEAPVKEIASPPKGLFTAGYYANASKIDTNSFILGDSKLDGVAPAALHVPIVHIPSTIATDADEYNTYPPRAVEGNNPSAGSTNRVVGLTPEGATHVTTSFRYRGHNVPLTAYLLSGKNLGSDTETFDTIASLKLVSESSDAILRPSEDFILGGDIPSDCEGIFLGFKRDGELGSFGWYVMNINTVLT